MEDNTVGAYEAKTHLPRLLERVAKGETITITKHGVPIAVLTPPPADRKMTPGEAADALRRFRGELEKRGVSISAEEIREMKHAGHKY
jgi:prevent-host-death family protein